MAKITTAITELLRSGPDTFTNIFDVDIQWPRYFDQANTEEFKNFSKPRIISFNLPYPSEIKTSEVSIGSLTMKKVLPGYNFSYNGSFSIRVDSNYIIERLFLLWQSISGGGDQYRFLNPPLPFDPYQDKEQTNQDYDSHYFLGKIILRILKDRIISKSNNSQLMKKLRKYEDITNKIKNSNISYIFDYVKITKVSRSTTTYSHNDSANIITLNIDFTFYDFSIKINDGESDFTNIDFSEINNIGV